MGKMLHAIRIMGKTLNTVAMVSQVIVSSEYQMAINLVTKTSRSTAVSYILSIISCDTYHNTIMEDMALKICFASE